MSECFRVLDAWYRFAPFACDCLALMCISHGLLRIHWRPRSFFASFVRRRIALTSLPLGFLDQLAASGLVVRMDACFLPTSLMQFIRLVMSGHLSSLACWLALLVMEGPKDLSR